MEMEIQKHMYVYKECMLFFFLGIKPTKLKNPNLVFDETKAETKSY